VLLDARFDDLDGPGGHLIAESAHDLVREWRREPSQNSSPAGFACRVARTPDGDVAYHALTVTYDGRRMTAFRATFVGPRTNMLGAFHALFRLAESFRCPPYILHYREGAGAVRASRSPA
jgi:hypothetical protein